MSSDTLNQNMKLLAMFHTNEISWADFVQKADPETIKRLFDEGISTINATRMQSGRYRYRRMYSGGLTPKGLEKMKTM
ncbi:hypothetical protein [Pseudomonas aeruginosa]|uniref:hypothetical protein n=1 Tax=Pseudomonas aeruginosa TaxID=287 RepID=UPI00128EB5A1|nr:hypothetical protein [Pseudomonas aeruginosa]